MCVFLLKTVSEHQFVNSPFSVFCSLNVFCTATTGEHLISDWIEEESLVWSDISYRIFVSVISRCLASFAS